jgi:sulfite exporter TauE/SafE
MAEKKEVTNKTSQVRQSATRSLLLGVGFIVSGLIVGTFFGSIGSAFGDIFVVLGLVFTIVGVLQFFQNIKAKNKSNK